MTPRAGAVSPTPQVRLYACRVNGNSSTGEDGLLEARRGFVTRIERERRRLEKRVQAILGDLARGKQAELAALRAAPLVGEAARAPRGTTLLVGVDWSSGEPRDCTLVLDPTKSPKDQLAALFTRARRLRKGGEIARARLEEAHVKLGRLAILQEAVMAATTLEELGVAGDAAHRADPSLLRGLAGPLRPPERTRPSPRVPYRTFVLTSGDRVLVGRGAADNDQLTLHVARPYDLWLHARGERGAHVVVPLKRGQPVAPEVLVDAAHLAAHFSDARGESVVDVSYAARRFIRKRRGSPPGAVQVDREKNLVLRVDPARLLALLSREEA